MSNNSIARIIFTRICLIIGVFSLGVLILIQAPRVIFAASHDQGVKASDKKTEEQKDEELIIELNKNIEEKQKEIDELDNQVEQYKQNITAKQKEAATLANEILLINDRISKKEYEINTQEATIERLVMEIDELNAEIEQKQLDILDTKVNLGRVINKIYQYDQKTLLEITLARATLSDYVTQVKYLENVQDGTKESLDFIKSLKASLENKEKAVNEKKDEVEAKKIELEGERDSLAGEKDFKNTILVETKMDEQKFQDLISQVKREQAQVNAEISSLEQEVRSRLQDQDIDFDDDTLLTGDVLMSWPVSTAKGISCEFHCADYPFRKYFEHSGIDIRLDQGTSVKAAASGIVAIAKPGPGYSYVLIVHGDRASSIYGHLSSLSVDVDELVQRGQSVGLSGGMPGLPGSGAYSTGPHLHFEIRVDGIPVNPRTYLP